LLRTGVMAFDWQVFLTRHSIDFTTSGPSTSRGNLYVHCPFCGSADAGHHMGVSLTGRGWGCWRSQTHRGRDPAKLIQALLGVSWAEAVRLAGRAAGSLPGGDGGFMAAINAALSGPGPYAPAQPLTAPRSFKRLDHGGERRLFHDYLLDRGFTRGQIDRMTRDHDLHYAMTGDWSYRLLIPVHDEDSNWVTWTGRAINATAKIRYKTLTANPDNVADGEPLARAPITDCLLGLPDLLHGGAVLFVGEGPFDAMRLSLFASDYDSRATCLFGKIISAAQIDLLLRLRPFYDDIVLLLDPDAALDALDLTTRLAPVGVKAHLLEGDDDPGEMRAQQIHALMSRFAKYNPLR
ncbi:MAG TPA: hypothetical protein VJM79_04270, partial [Rhizorhapis sp.]|nr:hypothetical protein [Rhizorhapis sp.]